MSVADQPDVAAETPDDASEQRRKEAYFTASQRQLIWARFRRNKTAMLSLIHI